MPKTKIIATLGPASHTYTVIRKMTRSGLDVARLNFSHGSHEEHLHRINIVREINKKYRRRVRIMQDLEGFRIRVGHFKKGGEKKLKKGKTVHLANFHDNGDPALIPLDYRGSLKIIRPGQFVYIDDGSIILKVKKTSKNSLTAEVEEGEALKERKGVNIPGARFPFSGMTEKDRIDLAFGLKHGVDYVAQSFVRRVKDVEEVKDAVKRVNPACLVVAKIEAREAIRNIDGIIRVSDGIMVARGDMGIAVPIYEVPVIQKMIIRKCNRAKKFVITATQMLEHMTEHSRPTRAEVTDVANAILDGTDFVMLSAESASGKYPVESVDMMNEIIKFTERHKDLVCVKN